MNEAPRTSSIEHTFRGVMIPKFIYKNMDGTVRAVMLPTLEGVFEQ